MRFLSLVGSILLITGCAPMEQAPLIYTSTVTFGANAGVGTTETPGFDFALGYKQVDAAYVPVAVAKNGDQSLEIYNIQAVSTDLNKKKTTASPLQLKELQDKETEIKNLKSQQAALTASIASKKQSEQSIKSILEDSTIDDDNRQEKELELQSLQEGIKKDEDESKSLSGKLLALEPEFKRLEHAAGIGDETNGEGNRYDAYSVYGSFDSKTTVLGSANASADTGLGKVFSTGVAAQRLAEAEKEKATKSTVYNCLKQLEAISTSKNITLTQEHLLMCAQK